MGEEEGVGKEERDMRGQERGGGGRRESGKRQEGRRETRGDDTGWVKETMYLVESVSHSVVLYHLTCKL